MMDHADAREALEVAAAEPDGLDRLMAGDTPAAAAVAGHLAGCDECAALLVALRRDASRIAAVVRTTPPADLRERTLAYVAQVGRPRGEAAMATMQSPGPIAVANVARPRAPLGGLAAIAAALVVAVAGTGFVVAAQRDAAIAQRDAELTRQTDQLAALNRITARAIRIAAEPDARQVALRGDDAALVGSIVFSATSGELAVVVDGLTDPPDGKEFRCWLEVDGERRPVGRMFFGGKTSFWAGPVDQPLADVTRFGVTLVDAGGTSLDGDPVLSGEL
jgi:hypothetical protein